MFSIWCLKQFFFNRYPLASNKSCSVKSTIRNKSEHIDQVIVEVILYSTYTFYSVINKYQITFQVSVKLLSTKYSQFGKVGPHNKYTILMHI